MSGSPETLTPMEFSGSAGRDLPFNNLVAFLGDSITASGINNDASNLRDTARGLNFWIPTLTRQAFRTRQDLNFGISGDTTAGALARVQDVIDSGAGTCVVLIGTNDIGTSIASVTANLEGIYQALSDAGILTIAMPLLPRTVVGTGEYGWMNTINHWIREQEANFPCLRVIDASRYVGDFHSLTMSPLPGYTYDGLHPMAIGARYAAQPVAEYLLSLRRPQDRMLSTITDHYWPVTNERGYINRNPSMSGTTGSKGTGISGVVADYWNLNRSEGGGDMSGLSITASKVTHPASGLEAQRIQYSGNVSGGWQTVITFTDFGLLYQEHFKPGDKVEFIVELDIPGALPAVSGVVPFFQIEQGGQWKSAYGGATATSDDWTNTGFRGVIRTPALTLTHALAPGENARCDVWIYFKNVPHTGVSGTVDILSAAVRKIVD